MTSYVYNPSKKITELLSQYLEFDPEQLQLGIWSGHLSLTDVQLRHEAIYPLLNKQAAAATASSAAEYAKPPLRFKLVSGRVGSLTMKIPWKRLVWGQGDVAIDLKNLVLVVALESREETEARRGQGADAIFQTDDALKSDNDVDKDEFTLNLEKKRRELKQKRLREAERRQLQGRPLAEWLAKAKRKDDAELVKFQSRADTPSEHAGRLEKWLKGATNDFFWRFYAGLEMTVENMKIVFVQDDIEMGFIFPSIQIVAGKKGNVKVSSNSPAQRTNNAEEALLDPDSTGMPPGDFIYEGEYEDGEHVDKIIKLLGVGTYVRKRIHRKLQQDAPAYAHVAIDVSTKDFVVRPVDIDFSFSLFFPFPPERRKKRKSKQSVEPRNHAASSDTQSITTGDSGSSSKRRRGKRDKIPAPQSLESLTAATEPTSTPSAPGRPGPIHLSRPLGTPASFGNSMQRPAMRRASTVGVIPQHRRRISVIGSTRATSIARAQPLLQGAPETEAQESSHLPLAEADDIVGAYAAINTNQDGHTPKFDGKLSISSVQAVLSTRHYQLINGLFAACAKMRNGRPAKSILSVLWSTKTTRLPLALSTFGDHNFPVAEAQTSAEAFDFRNAAVRNERTDVVMLWWRYMLGVIVWELRQRRRLRKHFQDKFLSFDWIQQRHKRAEYVNLYIKYLAEQDINQFADDSVGEIRRSAVEELLEIEDELFIEQILLYRSIARALHVRGERAMPPSILDVTSSVTQNLKLANTASPNHKKTIMPDEHNPDERPNYLNRIELRCETARRRRDAEDDAVLSLYDPYMPWTDLAPGAVPMDFDETTLGTNDRTVKTFRTSKSKQSVAMSLLESISSDSPSNGMFFSFSFLMENLELMLVDDDIPQREVGPHQSTTSIGGMSDVSVLTDDQRFFVDDDELSGTAVENESESQDPVVSSTDYLLFRVPDVILLNLSLSKLKGSALGRTKGSRNLNFTVDRIQAQADDNSTILSLGKVSEDDQAMKDLRLCESDTAETMPRAALTVSLVNKEETVIQSDAASICCSFDLKILQKVVGFFRSNVPYPSPVLPQSANEGVRLFVIRQNSFSTAVVLNCSIRIHGIVIEIPSADNGSSCDSDSALDGLSHPSANDSIAGAKVTCGMVEVYSGSAVETLRASSGVWKNEVLHEDSETSALKSGKTRGLKMLNIVEHIEWRKSFLSSHWVFAVSGVDVVVAGLGESIDQYQTILENKVDVEALFSLNSNSVLSFDCAKQEAVVRVSAIHFLFSEEITSRIFTIIPVSLPYSSNPSPSPPFLPPRLEVLSRLVLYSVDFSVASIQASFLTQSRLRYRLGVSAKLQEMESAISDFLKVVSMFDLSYPHEDALSVAMQICIERLHGLGLAMDTSWEAANTSLLNYYEDIAQIRQSLTLIVETDDANYVIKCATRLAIERTVALYRDRLVPDLESCLRPNEFSIALPQGLTIALVHLFYDRHWDVSVPSFLLMNGDGMNLLKVLASDTAGVEHSVDASDKSSNVLLRESTTKPSDSGFAIRSFEVDQGFPLGRGGSPLGILGFDRTMDYEGVERKRERLLDIELADTEIMICPSILEELGDLVLNILKPIHAVGVDDQPVPPLPQQGRPGLNTSFLVASDSFSLILVSDDLVPFCHGALTGIVVKKEDSQAAAVSPTWKLTADSLEISNLASSGETHPVIVAVFPDISVPVRATASFANRTSRVQLTLNGIRVIVVRQFINEILQYFAATAFKLDRYVNISGEKPPTGDRAETAVVTVVLNESSIIIPKSCRSVELTALEVGSARILLFHDEHTFHLPNSEHPLTCWLRPEFSGPEDDTRETLDSSAVSVARTLVEVRTFEIFTCIAQTQAERTMDASPAFRVAYALDGRASTGKRVFYRRVSLGDPSTNDLQSTDDDIMERCWEGAMLKAASLDVLIDRANHLRLLITDPITDGVTQSNRICLDLTIPQFSLLLSIWYINMQELPIMFPYSASQLLKGATNLSKGHSFPSYGTKEFGDLLVENNPLTSEIAVHFKDFSMKCHIAELAGDPPKAESATGLILSLSDVVTHITSDSRGITKIGGASRKASITDGSLLFSRILCFGEQSHGKEWTWANQNFGVNSNLGSIQREMHHSLQFSIHLTPECSLYNFGFDSPMITVSDFTPVFMLLDFLTRYSTDPLEGHPAFAAMDQVEKIKMSLRRDLVIGENEPDAVHRVLDFRLWIRQPSLCIPCDPFDRNAPCLLVHGDETIWYHYASYDAMKIHECVSRALSLCYCERSDVVYHNKGFDGRPLIERFSFGVCLASNSETNHSDVNLQIPFSDSNACALTSNVLIVKPKLIEIAPICSPPESYKRHLGILVCELTCIIELLPVVSSALVGLFAGGSELTDSGMEFHDNENEHESMLATELKDHNFSMSKPELSNADYTYSIICNVSDVRLFALDPVLGPHLPVATVSISHLQLTMSQFGGGTGGSPVEGKDPSPDDLQVSIDCLLWADYFKLGLTRSWEPLVEPYKWHATYERSQFRGSGLVFSSDVPLHLNISGSLLMILDEVIDVYWSLIQKTFNTPTTIQIDQTVKDASIETPRSITSVYDDLIEHVQPKYLEPTDRVAFSLRNLTGQEMRICNESQDKSNFSNAAVVSYVDHGSSMKLTFKPSISVIMNLSAIDIPYPGLPNLSLPVDENRSVSPHSVDIQIPGFRWVKGVKVDTFGRQFVKLSPRSEILNSKIQDDWRLGNLMNLLFEVGLNNGGRQVTLRSLFSIENRTSHEIVVQLHPDPSAILFNSDSSGDFVRSKDSKQAHASDTPDVRMEPGDTFQVPTLLLEASLQLPGSHLGSVWIRPAVDSSTLYALDSFLRESSGGTEDIHVENSSRPIQLARIVSDSATLFEESNGEDVPPERAKSGVQLSCPLVQKSGNRLAPFCYTVEVSRSPLVKAEGQEPSTKRRKRSYQHGPLAYTLSIHPTFVLVNLLPEKGRFELMHAIRRTVLWYADLEPGQEVPIHAVGLDAPLLLLLNLGYCRTPVGEGALVHHGVDPTGGSREALLGLKTIGKAGKAVTKQIGKTLTTIGDSPDKRGFEKLVSAQHPQFAAKREKETKSPLVVATKDALGLGSDIDEIEKVGGKAYRIDTPIFLPQDVAAETSVVDCAGQRLTLNIENKRGGGGQRRISVFCPFWIVNTTEHALRYKQDNNKGFVCGTVTSREKDGSVPLSGGRARIDTQAGSDEPMLAPRRLLNERTIFGGTFGALATSPGRCDLPASSMSRLIDTNLPLHTLSHLAFMFNFHEGILSGGNQKFCIQLHDGTGATRYSSDWSKGLSLDSVGVSQVVGIHCKEGRSLELSVVVSVAPGVLSGYTKIVRILPRYVVVNLLPFPVRLWQDSSIFRPVREVENEMERNWRFPSNAVRQSRYVKVNQYEALWGRHTVLDERFDDNLDKTTSAPASALYISTVRPSEIIPFNLPDTRGDRQLRIGLGGHWELTASFSADVSGDYCLNVNPFRDLKMLPHVPTRASPQYEVKLGPEEKFSGELGVWFETEWGSNRSLIVKAVKKNSYAFNETDIHVGDELLRIDGLPVARMTFSESMSILKRRLNEISGVTTESRRTMRRSSLRLINRNRSENFESNHPFYRQPITLTFRTVEERLRRVRLKAAKSDVALMSSNHAQVSRHDASTSDSKDIDSMQFPRFLNAELRSLHHSLFLVLKEEDYIPYQIQNRTIGHVIYYRQKGCNNHTWKSLRPGQLSPYSWEEPMKPKRLMIRVAPEKTIHLTDGVEADHSEAPIQDKEIDSTDVVGQYRRIRDEEDTVFSPSVYVRLEEIGYRDILPYQWSNTECGQRATQFLDLEVDVVGSTRVLIVNDALSGGDEQQLRKHLEGLEQRCKEEEVRLNFLRHQSESLSSSLQVARSQTANDTDVMLKHVYEVMDDFPSEQRIQSVHQVVVDVIEATGLAPDSLTGTCNPYAEVTMKSGVAPRRSFFLNRKDVRRTYYIKKSVSPTWINQVFVFDVAPEAANVTRGHSIQVRLKSFRVIGSHNTLGKAYIDLHCLRNQESLVGWFPLAGRTGKRELENQMSPWGRGSVKLRVQWVYSAPAVIRYFISLSGERLTELQDSWKGMAQLLESKREAGRIERAKTDAFKAVRVKDLLSIPHSRAHKRFKQLSPGDAILHPKKLVEPIVSKAEKILMVSQNELEITKQRLSSEESVLGRLRLKDFEGRRKPNPLSQRLSGTAQYFEEQISKQRLNFQAMPSSRHLWDRRQDASLLSEYADSLPISSFKTWVLAQTLMNDNSIEVDAVDDEVKLRLSVSPSKSRWTLELQTYKSFSSRLIAKQLGLYPRAPMKLFDAKEHIDAYIASRIRFERYAMRTLKTALHPGGWLIFRPFTALNLPDNYSGMHVKLKFGADVISTDTVDARVYPTWNKQGDCKVRRYEVDSEESVVSTEQNENDLHIHVAPQKTSGSIRISVVGERSQQKLNPKTEIGVIEIPLGAAIAACIDNAVQGDTMNGELDDSMYIRWFPLVAPRVALPMEGDGGLSARPIESEQLSDTMFHDYFAPCIQLGISWWPDTEERARPDSRGMSEANIVDTERDSSPIVENYFVADVGCLSAALIDSQRAFELLSLNISDVDLRYWVTKAKSRVGLSCGWVQIDYQDMNAREPVVFAPTPSDIVVPVVQALAVKDNIRSRTHVLSFDFIDVSVVEFDFTVEESLLFHLFGFFNSISLRKGMHVKANEKPVKVILRDEYSYFDESLEVEEPTLHALLFDSGEVRNDEEPKVYIEQLFLGVIKVNISYLKGKKTEWELTEEGNWVNRGIQTVISIPSLALAGSEELAGALSLRRDKSDIFRGWSQHTYDEDRRAEDRGKTSQNLPSLIAALFPTISDAPVRLPGKALNHVFESPNEILHSIRKYYVNETLKQIYKIIGSLDFVGNPTMLFTSFFSGIRDLVVTPSVAFLRSPTDPSSVGLGVAKGTLSLLSHSVSGFFGFCAKVSAAAGQIVATLSLDADFRAWHQHKIVVEATNLNREWKRRGMQSIQATIGRPLGDIAIGTAAGVAGVFLSPIKGFRSGGNVGLIKGFGIGGLGLVAKPTVGVLDAFAHFTASIHDIAKSVNVLERRLQPALRLRLPYSFGIKNVLEPFDPIVSRANSLLKSFPPKKNRGSDTVLVEYVIHVEVLPNVESDTIAIVTTKRVVLFRLKKEISGNLSATLGWEVYHGGDSVLSSRVSDHGHSGVALTITLTRPESEEKAEDAIDFDTLPFSPADEHGFGMEESTPSQRTIGLATPDEGLVSVDTSEEFKHGTTRGKGGELLEWFSVLAEYQYRRQLSRLHNSICCIVRDFDSIIWDPSLGQKGATEGYTSFGIFYFGRENSHIAYSRSKEEIVDRLDNLRWIAKSALESIISKIPEKHEREESAWTFEDELQEAIKEGGPQWLSIARARARFNQVFVPHFSPSSESESKIFYPQHHTPAERRMLPTILDDERDDACGGLVENDSLSFPRSSPLRGSTATNSLYLSAKEDVFTSMLADGEDNLSPGRRLNESLAKIEIPRDDLTTKLPRCHSRVSSAGSFYSAYLSTSPPASEFVSPSSEAESEDERTSSEGGETLEKMQSTPGADLPPTVPYDGKGAPDNTDVQLLTNMSPSIVLAAHEESERSARTYEDGFASTTNECKARKTVRPSDSTKYEDRIERMEKLMDRLLLFTSEQTLQSRLATVESIGHADIQLLHNEINELRDKLALQAKTEQSTNEEIVYLRREVARLKAQMPMRSFEDEIRRDPSEHTDTVFEECEDID